MILRRILPDGVELIQALGDKYTLVKKETSPVDFQKFVDIVDEGLMDTAYAVIYYNEGSESIALFKGSYYYIMSDSGKTFDNLTFK